MLFIGHELLSLNYQKSICTIDIDILRARENNYNWILFENSHSLHILDFWV